MTGRMHRPEMKNARRIRRAFVHAELESRHSSAAAPDTISVSSVVMRA